MLTGIFCFELTTGLTHRWLLYYSIAPTLLRLLSLQSICWPSTFITLRFLGHFDLLLAWIVVGTTTACSRSVQIWVTSNVPEVPMISALNPGAIIRTQNILSNGNGINAAIDLSPEDSVQIKGVAKHDNVWNREREWNWSEIGKLVWLRVGILYFLTTSFLLWQRR